MKKIFKFTLETDTGFPHDLYNDYDFEQRLQESVDEMNWVFPGTPVCKVSVEEL